MRKATLTEAERLKKEGSSRLIDTKLESLHCNLVWLILRLENGLNSSQIKESI